MELVVLLTLLLTYCWIHWGLELQLSFCCSVPVIQVPSAVFLDAGKKSYFGVLNSSLEAWELCKKSYVSNLGNEFWYFFDCHSICLWSQGRREPALNTGQLKEQHRPLALWSIGVAGCTCQSGRRPEWQALTDLLQWERRWDLWSVLLVWKQACQRDALHIWLLCC